MNFERITDFLFGYDASAPMIFNSGIFLVLFIFFISIYAIIHKNRLPVTLFVIAFGCLFYYKSSGWYLLILIMTVFTDYGFALLLARMKDSVLKKIVLFLALSVSIGLLSYFKYTNFFLGNFYEIMGNNFQPLDIFLPIGVSFYTFQSMSYMLDVYWKKITPCYNIIDYAFFITFFPQLVAGPIVKANWFLPQIKKPISIKPDWVYSGLWLVMVGLFKKAVIADYISQYNDLVFNNPGGYSGFENLMAVYGYTLQIYCDFSGYSDMAIGIARIMGFDLGINFNFPYKAKNITEFWHKWHMSLSTWLRDYLYIPLGGNREVSFFSVISIPLILLLIIIFVAWKWYHLLLFAIVTATGLLAYYKPKFKIFTYATWIELITLAVLIYPFNLVASVYLAVVLVLWLLVYFNPATRQKLITSLNQMLTMLIGGLWHGATWKFVFWGALHGIGLAVHKATKPLMDRIPNRFPSNAVSWFVTFHFVIFLWIFFRATDIKHEVYKHTEPIAVDKRTEAQIDYKDGKNALVVKVYKKDSLQNSIIQPLEITTNDLRLKKETKEGNEIYIVNQVEDGYHVAWGIIGKITKDIDSAYIFPFLKVRYMWVILLVIGFVMHSTPIKWNMTIQERFIKSHYLIKLFVFIILVQLVIQFKSEDVQPFIYFQF